MCEFVFFFFAFCVLFYFICLLFLLFSLIWTSFDVGLLLLLGWLVYLFVFVVDHDKTRRQRSLLLDISKRKRARNLASGTESNSYVLYAREFSSLKVFIYVIHMNVCRSHTHKFYPLLVFFSFLFVLSSAPVVVFVAVYFTLQSHSSSSTSSLARSFYQILHFINHIQHLPCTVLSAAHSFASVGALCWNGSVRVYVCVRCLSAYSSALCLFSVKYSRFLVSKNTIVLFICWLVFRLWFECFFLAIFFLVALEWHAVSV